MLDDLSLPKTVKIIQFPKQIGYVFIPRFNMARNEDMKMMIFIYCTPTFWPHAWLAILLYMPRVISLGSMIGVVDILSRNSKGWVSNSSNQVSQQVTVLGSDSSGTDIRAAIQWSDTKRSSDAPVLASWPTLLTVLVNLDPKWKDAQQLCFTYMIIFSYIIGYLTKGVKGLQWQGFSYPVCSGPVFHRPWKKFQSMHPMH